MLLGVNVLRIPVRNNNSPTQIMEVLRHIPRYRANFQLVSVRKNANRRLPGWMSNLVSLNYSGASIVMSHGNDAGALRD